MQMSERLQKILILEDDLQTRDLLTRLLSSGNRVVLSASTVAEANHILQAHIPDLLLVDIYLPDGSGIKFLSDLKAKSKDLCPFPRVIIMTAFGSWETHVEAYHLGAFYYLDKPFKVTQLRTLVEHALAAT